MSNRPLWQYGWVATSNVRSTISRTPLVLDIYSKCDLIFSRIPGPRTDARATNPFDCRSGALMPKNLKIEDLKSWPKETK